MKQINQGAEARIYEDEESGKIIKERFRKKYRIPEIDDKIRKFRTRREAKIFEKLKEIGVLIPNLISMNDKEMKIEMEKIDGKVLKDCLTENLAENIGEIVGKMHSVGIIHGDLTTSNMILKNKKIYFIDFGLSDFSDRDEDKAVDLHLLKQALESKHHKIFKKCFDAVIKGYEKNYSDFEKVFKRLEIVENRGRNKKK